VPDFHADDATATQETQTQAALAVTKGYVEANGVNYHRIYGEGEPLLLLHGDWVRSIRHPDAEISRRAGR
jgi:hypothetical protein